MVIRVKKKKGVFEKAKGLLGTKKPEGIYFETRWGIHTFFMKFPIDVVILDDGNNVVKLKESLTPNHIFFWNPKYKHVVELPQNTIVQKKITKGKTIQCVSY